MVQAEIHTDRGNTTQDFSPSLSVGQNLNALSDPSLHVPMPCGGTGKCGKCKIHVTGQLSGVTPAERELLPAEELKAGVRLACRARPEGRCAVDLQSNGREMDMLADLYVDADIPCRRQGYGVAADIGTTTVVTGLFRLSDGQMVSMRRALNRQLAFGADVITRMAASVAGSRQQLSDLLVDQLACMIADCCEGVVLPSELTDIVLTGNTVVLHLLENYDVKPLSAAPFTPQSLFGRNVPDHAIARRLSSGAGVYLPRCLGPFVGADITCGVIASGMYKSGQTSLLADLGTNGEILVRHGGRVFGTSTAAGPAFEGVEISQGMPAATGAIHKVWLEDGTVRYATIGGAPPAGLCGSGLIDAVAVMLAAGAVDDTGALQSDSSFAIGDSGVFVTQGDIRKVQLAKSAIHAGILTMLDKLALGASEIDRFFLAGGFGQSLSVKSAAAIGLIPRRLLDKTVTPIGNSALSGAYALLMNGDLRDTCGAIGASAEIFDLSASPFFANCYVDNMTFETEVIP